MLVSPLPSQPNVIRADGHPVERVRCSQLIHYSSLSSLQSEKTMRGWCFRFFNHLCPMIQRLLSWCCRRGTPQVIAQPLPIPAPLVPQADLPRSVPAPVVHAIPAAEAMPQEAMSQAVPLLSIDAQDEEMSIDDSDSDLVSELFDEDINSEISAAEVSEVASIEEAPASPVEEPMLSLMEASELVLRLYDELIPERLQEIVDSPRWTEIQEEMDQINDHIVHSNFFSDLLQQNYQKLEILISVGIEWQRFLENEENEIAPFPGEVEHLNVEGAIRHLPELLSAAREQLRLPPSEIDIGFVLSLKARIETMNPHRFRELKEVLSLTEKLYGLHSNGFFQRAAPEHFADTETSLDQLLQHLSPDGLEAYVRSQRANTILNQLGRMFGRIPPQQINQFSFLCCDRIEVVVLLGKVAEEWERHLQNPEIAHPYRGRHLEIEELNVEEREDLCIQVLRAAREQVRKAPEEIDLNRLLELEDIVDSFYRGGAEFLVEPFINERLDSIKQAIQIARSLKELHEERYFE